jgi:thiamine kinase
MDPRVPRTAYGQRVTGLLTPEDALSRVPGFDADPDFREIGGGLTNRSFVVRSGGRQFVLRLDAKHTSTFGLDRSTEFRILRNAAEVSLAPEVRFADPDSGILVYEYLPGPVWDRASLDDSDNLGRLAALLRRVHGLSKSGVALDALAAALRYQTVASRHSQLRADAARCVEIVRASPEPPVRCCCHNDVVAANVVGDTRLKLLDWEYACDNDPYFDLASLIGYHDLSSRQTGRLLDGYTGARTPEAKERLELQLRLYNAIQWLWFAARCVIDPNSEHRARLEQIRRQTR